MPYLCNIYSAYIVPNSKRLQQQSRITTASSYMEHLLRNSFSVQRQSIQLCLYLELATHISLPWFPTSPVAFSPSSRKLPFSLPFWNSTLPQSDDFFLKLCNQPTQSKKMKVLLNCAPQTVTRFPHLKNFTTVTLILLWYLTHQINSRSSSKPTHQIFQAPQVIQKKEESPKRKRKKEFHMGFGNPEARFSIEAIGGPTFSYNQSSTKHTSFLHGH